MFRLFRLCVGRNTSAEDVSRSRGRDSRAAAGDEPWARCHTRGFCSRASRSAGAGDVPATSPGSGRIPSQPGWPVCRSGGGGQRAVEAGGARARRPRRRIPRLYDAQSGVASNISLRVGRPARGLDRAEGGGATAYLLGRDHVLRHLCFERHVRGTRGSECRAGAASSIESRDAKAFSRREKISQIQWTETISYGEQSQTTQESQEFLRAAETQTCAHGCHLAPRQNRTAARGRCQATLAMGFMAMFKKKDPKDLVREWQSKMRTEMRGVDRQIRGALASRTSRRRGTFPRRRLRAVHGRLTTERARSRSARRAVFATNTTRRPRLPTDGP